MGKPGKPAGGPPQGKPPLNLAAAMMPPRPRKRRKINPTRAQAQARARAAAAAMTFSRKEINRIIKAGFDYGDREIALRTLGLHLRPLINFADPEMFLQRVNRIFALVHPRNLNLAQYQRPLNPRDERRAVVERAIMACEIVLMAIRTIGGFQNVHWDHSIAAAADIVVNMGDIRPGAVWDNRDPLMDAEFNAHKGALPLAGPRGTSYKAANPDVPITDAPTTNEVIQACWNRVRFVIGMDYYLPNNKPTPVQVGQPQAAVLREYLSPPDGNCLWYALR